MRKKYFAILLTCMLAIIAFYPPITLSNYDTIANYTHWPLLRVDASNTGFTSASFPSTMEFSELLPVQSQRPPIVANNNYFLVELGSGTVHCFELETQELIWKKKYSTMTDENILMGNCCVFSEATNELLLLETVKGNWERKSGFTARVYAINPENGSVQWQEDIPGYYANSLTVSDKEVFVKVIEIRSTSRSNYLSIQNRIYSYDLQNGEKNWSSGLLYGGEGYWSFNAPAFNDRYITVPSTNCIKQNEDGTITAVDPCYMSLLDRNTGQLLDTIAMDGFVGTSMPLLIGSKVYVISTLSGTGTLPNYLYCFSITGNRLRQDYKLLLSQERHDYIYNVNLAKHENYLYFLDYSGSLICISPENGSVKWRKQVGEKSWVGPYFCTSNYVIICTIHRTRTKESNYSYENHIMIQYIDPETGVELFSNSVPFNGYPPQHLSGTEDHIWAVCGWDIAHFTPKEVLALTVNPMNIMETSYEGETDLLVNNLEITIQGKVTGTINWNEPWLECDTNTIHPDLSKVKVTIDPTGLQPGKYTDSVRFQSNAGKVVIPVRLDIKAEPKLDIIPGSVELTIPQGTSPEPTIFSIRNIGGAGLKGTIHSTEDWITVSQTALNDTQTAFTAQYNMDAKEPGIYEGSILAISNGGNQTIPITITIIAAPFLVVTPSEIIQEVAIGSSSLVDLHLTNAGGQGLSGTITSDKEWLLAGTNQYNDTTNKVVLTLDARTLKAGTYRGNIVFTGNDQVITVPVTLQCIVWITLRIGSRTIEVNTKPETISSAPYLFEKRTYVPVRKLVESLPVLHYIKNTNLEWNAEEQKVTITIGEKTIKLWVNEAMADIDGKAVQIDPDNSNITPQIREGRTFLPLRFIAENLGYKVEWMASTQTIHLKYHVVGDETKDR